MLYYYTFKPKLLAILFDVRLAEADGINTRLYVYTIIFLVGTTVVLLLKLVGGFLVFTLIYNLAVTTMQLTRHIRRMLILAPLMGVTVVYLGLFMSFLLDLPVGVCIVISSIIMLLISVTIRRSFKV